jgi:acyl dehydratase
MVGRYFEAVGQTFGSGRTAINAEQIQRFAQEFDPQSFHLDPAAARETIFRGLAASGWHIAAITMRLLLGSGIDSPAGSWARAATSSAGRDPYVPAMNCSSKLRSWD